MSNQLDATNYYLSSSIQRKQIFYEKKKTTTTIKMWYFRVCRERSFVRSFPTEKACKILPFMFRLNQNEYFIYEIKTKKSYFSFACCFYCTHQFKKEVSFFC